MTINNTIHSRGRTCAKCSDQAVDRFGGEWLCRQHLNPDIPPRRVEEIVLQSSNWAPFDELERLYGMGGHPTKR